MESNRLKKYTSTINLLNQRVNNINTKISQKDLKIKQFTDAVSQKDLEIKQLKEEVYMVENLKELGKSFKKAGSFIVHN